MTNMFHMLLIYVIALHTAAETCTDKMEEKAYRMSSCASSKEWVYQTLRCHAHVVEDVLCVRVNTIQSFQEANRLAPHKFELQKSLSSGRSKV